MKPGSSSRSRPSSSGSANDEPTSPAPSVKEAGHETHTHVYITSLDQLPQVKDEPPELRDLNNCLVALAAIFPDVQVEVFREMLSSFEAESRLAVVSDQLIKNKLKWCDGQYRLVGKDASKSDNRESNTEEPGTVPAEERFRSASYKLAVKNAAYNEFKGLSHSTVKAVLAENNFSFIRSRPTLAALNSKTWRSAFSTMFSRKKTGPDQSHWVVWHSSGKGSILPTLRTTGCPELDRELYDALVAPLNRNHEAEVHRKDRELAWKINAEEATEAEALTDCECCYGATTFEEVSVCSSGGHFVCFQCVRHSINEAIFGQGWARSINAAAGSLRCMAPVSDECHGSIQIQQVHRALQDEKGGADIIRKLDQRLAEDNLVKSGVSLVRCPFCSYAEIDHVYLPTSDRSWRMRQHSPYTLLRIGFTIVCFGSVPFLIPSLVFLTFAFLLACSHPTVYAFALHHLELSLNRVRRRQRGPQFRCQNPSCLRTSCMTCSKAWTDIHICHESTLQTLRTEIEQAMSLAIKRTCPRCNTSFVKSSGCNKLTCVCGYQMCYVCRKDIGAGGEGYRHFCDHFRATGTRGCTECDKCDLYQCEDEQLSLKKAKEQAEAKWLEKEGAGNKELTRKIARSYEDTHSGFIAQAWRRRPEWKDVIDAVVEFLIE